MSTKNCIQLMAEVAAIVNGDATAPTTGSDEYNLFLSALNRAEGLWGEAEHDWENLRMVYKTTLGLSGTSVALPSGFKKVSGFISIEGKRRITIDPKDEIIQSEDSEYCAPHLAENYLAIYPAAASVSAVVMYYHSKVTSLATTTATPLCPSDEYLINKASSLLLFGRSDPRYSELRDEADLLLERMVGSEVSKLKGNDNTIPSHIDDYVFTLGQDI